MENLYFTFWIQKHGKELFTQLINLVTENATLPETIQNPDSNISKDEYLFHYFFVVYCMATLDYFGLNTDQISFTLDLFMPLGVCEAFPPKKTSRNS